jgi:hypothetical protein
MGSLRGGHCGTEGSMRREHAGIPMAMPARGQDQGLQPVEELHGCEGERRLPEAALV